MDCSGSTSSISIDVSPTTAMRSCRASPSAPTGGVPLAAAGPEGLEDADALACGVATGCLVGEATAAEGDAGGPARHAATTTVRATDATMISVGVSVVGRRRRSTVPSRQPPCLRRTVDGGYHHAPGTRCATPKNPAGWATYHARRSTRLSTVGRSPSGGASTPHCVNERRCGRHLSSVNPNRSSRIVPITSVAGSGSSGAHRAARTRWRRRRRRTGRMASPRPWSRGRPGQ